MFIDDFDLNKKEDIFLIEKIGDVIKSHFILEEILCHDTFSHYEFSKTTYNSRPALKFSLFYKETTKEFYADDFRIYEIVSKGLTKTNRHLTANYNVLMSIEMNKRHGNNSYFEHALDNLSENEIKYFDETLEEKRRLQEFFEKINNSGLEK